MSTLPDWKSRAVSAADAMSVVRSGTNIFIHGACATPAPLIEALCARHDLEAALASHALQRQLIELKDRVVIASDDQERGRLQGAERSPGQIDPSTARHDRPDPPAEMR